MADACKHQELDYTLSLAGVWGFDFDPNDKGIEDRWFERPLADTIELPGTTDERRKGPENTECETMSLTRVHPYVGPAFYQKELNIPDDWQGKRVFFSIERTKPSTVWINDQLIGSKDSLTTTHTYDLSAHLTPGKHRLTVRIDTADNPPVGLGHQLSEHTQTNWNGMLGNIELQAKDTCFIDDLQAYPDVANKQVKLSLTFNTACSGELTVSATPENSVSTHRVEQAEVVTTDDTGRMDVIVSLGDEMQCWDEFNPALYRLSVTFRNENSCDSRTARIGMREFTTDSGQFQVNGGATFLRGKHDACVFPLTGYAPMDSAEWKRVLTVAKSYGINHYRFHSWCPPRAAFEAADEVGIYMQPELPLWESIGVSDVDPLGDVEFKGSGDESVMDARIRYLVAEGIRILKQFGNHPSFCMFALGNELSGDIDVMASLIRRFRQEDPRKLYAHGSNNFIFESQKGPADDYWTTMMTGGHYRRGDFKPDSKGREVRGSFCAHNHGHVNNAYPSTSKDFSSALVDVDVPVIGHEVGQYQVFPDFREIDKYTGVLQARNLEVFRENLDQAGMLDLADDFFRASGALSVICYREDIEAALRTPQFGGFQLLDIQDFPGQGTALVGVLDAFMDSKGLITPEAWREFCNDVVVLAKMPKYTWTRSETFSAEICVANYGRISPVDHCVCWALTDLDGNVLANGQSQCVLPDCNPVQFSAITIDLGTVSAPRKLNLSLQIEGTAYRNHYPIWVYDDVNPTADSCVQVTELLTDDVLRSLESGATVLLAPANGSVKDAIPGAFQTDFWCYPMFKKYAPPGTMGILCDPAHPALSGFPTEFHSNWQWWPLLKNGCAMILDNMPCDLEPIVRVIDNFERNHRLGVVFEACVGQGKLLVCSCDLLNQQNYPEARQLLSSLLDYMGSDQFCPKCDIAIERLGDLFL